MKDKDYDPEENVNMHSDGEYLEDYSDFKSSPQQPIPQDINKWIEDEAEKYAMRMTEAPERYKLEAKEHFECGALLLLPELQQVREEIKFKNFNEKRLIDECNSCIAEIESLEKHCQDYRKNVDDLDSDLTYWKQRCKAAEEVNRYGHYEVTGTESDVFQEWWDKWQALKQQTHG